MPWQILLGISLGLDVIGRLVHRILMREDKSEPVTYAIVYQFLAGGILIVFALFQGIHGPSNWAIWPNLLIMPFLWTATNLFIFNAFKYTEASIYTILFTTRVIWIIAVSILFLHESFSLVQALGTFLIFVAVFLVSWKHQKMKFGKGEKYSLLGAMAFGLAIVNDSYIVRSFDVVTYLGISFTVPAVVMLLVFYKSFPKVKLLLKDSIMKKIFLLSAIYGVDAVFYLYAYKAGNNAAQLAGIAQITTILTVLAAIFILKEKSHVWIKILAGIVSFVGVLLVAR